jgi:hypothetical protein
MVRVLLQPRNRGELDPTGLEDQILASLLESHGWALKSPWNRPSCLSIYCFGSWGVNGDEWWLCRVSHGSYPFIVDRNRCHRFSETGSTEFYLTRRLLSIFSKLHFLFHFPFFLRLYIHFCTTFCLRYGFWEILMKCEKSKVCNPLR